MVVTGAEQLSQRGLIHPDTESDRYRGVLIQGMTETVLARALIQDRWARVPTYQAARDLGSADMLEGSSRLPSIGQAVEESLV